MPGSSIDTRTAEELENLMNEFPDWKEQFPEIYQDAYPTRYSKINGKKDRIAPANDDRIIAKRATTVPHSDYQDTYPRHRAYRPRSTKRPPQTPLERHPPPMSFDTNQRVEFTQKDLGVRAELVKFEDQYERPEGHIDGASNYRRDYQGHYNLPSVRSQPFDPSKKTRKDTSAKFESRTTAKEHFKPWNSCPSKPFAELPSFTGSILYPEPGHQLDTTTGTTFQGALGRRSDPFSQEGNLKIEGDVDHKTTHKLTFHGFDNPRPAQRIRNIPDTMAVQRGRFAGKSQTSSDFSGFDRGQPRPRKAAEPAPETIDLKFNNKQEFVTEQRKEFPGVDIRLHPMAKLCLQEDNTYKPPTVKFETSTSQKMDYQPIDVENAHRTPVRPSTFHKSGNNPKFDDRTTHNDLFKKWETPAKVRYGDFHEGHKYIPPVDRFDNTTTNQDVFLGSSAPIRDSFKPEDKPVNEGGVQDFNTMYRVTFDKPKVAKRFTKQQAQMLLSELRRRKGGQSITTTPRTVFAN